MAPGESGESRVLRSLARQVAPHERKQTLGARVKRVGVEARADTRPGVHSIRCGIDRGVKQERLARIGPKKTTMGSHNEAGL
jgi:hypothetical protein